MKTRNFVAIVAGLFLFFFVSHFLAGCATVHESNHSQAPEIPANLIVKDAAGNWVRLEREMCAQGGWLSLWKRAAMFFQGKQYDGCWRASGPNVTIMDSNGDVTDIPQPAFRIDEGV